MDKKNEAINYGVSLATISKTMRNPMLIHKIQDYLMALDQMELLMKGILGAAIVSYAKIAPDACIKILWKANREEVVNLIGEPTMKLIDEYMGEEKPETINDIPVGTFERPGNKENIL